MNSYIRHIDKFNHKALGRLFGTLTCKNLHILEELRYGSAPHRWLWTSPSRHGGRRRRVGTLR